MFPHYLVRPVMLLMAVLAAVVLLLTASSRPAGAEIDSTPNSWWGVTGLGPAQTNNFNAQVWSIEQIGNVIYVGGKFTQVKGGAVAYDQPYLAAFEASTGRWLDWWTPEINAPVYALHASPDGNTLFVGGEFTTVNGASVPAFAALDAQTGETRAGWNTRVSGGNPASVKALEMGADGMLYIGGGFNSIARNGVVQSGDGAVRIDPSTGGIDAGWKPVVAGGGVWDIALAPDQSRVYLGGYFTSVNGAADTKAFAAVRHSNGAAVDGVVDYEPNYEAGGRGRVHAVAAVGNLVYVAGEEHSVQVLHAGDLTRKFVHYTGQPAEQGWALSGGGDFQDLEVVGDRVYASCHCWRQHLEAANGNLYPTTAPGPGTWSAVKSVVAYNATSGTRIDSFQLDLRGSAGVWAMKGHSTDGCLWIGGQLTQAGGVAANNLVRLCDSAGPGPAAGPPATPPTDPPPAAPATCSATLQGSDVVLTWSSVADADRYVLRRSRDSGPLSWMARVNAPSLSYLNTTTVGGSTYGYTVESVNADGSSNPVTCGGPVTVPAAGVAAPGSCATSVAGGTLTTQWNAVAGATHYIVRRSRDGGASFWLSRVNTPATSFVRPVPPAGSVYSYTVEAVGGGTVSPLSLCGSIDRTGGGGLAVAPTSCAATQVDASTYRINWVPAANDNAADYIVRRSRDGGPFAWAGRISAPATSFTNVSVPVGPVFSYTVEARAADGSVAVTNCTVPANGPAGPAVAPAGCSATLVDADTVRVTWTRAANDKADGFVIKRSRNGNPFAWAGRVPAPGVEFNNDLQWGGTYLYTVETRAPDGSVAVTNCTPAAGIVR
jgi:hypothetical protein